MFATSRFPQLGILATLLAGCASTAGSVDVPTITEPPARAVAVPLPMALVAPPPSPAGVNTFEAAATAFAAQAAASREIPLDWTRAAMAQARHDDQVKRLMTPTRQGKPVVRSWSTYRKRFVEPIRIRQGKTFLATHGHALAQAEHTYGVPAEIITAIIGIETLYGTQTGNFRVLDALATLALAYPDQTRPERAEMFREQLADFLLWTYHSGQAPTVPRGSFAGAMGIPQFMPTSMLKYAVDGDGDKDIDLQANPVDAIFSVANFLREHGWTPSLPVFAPVRLGPEPETLVDGGLTPHHNWDSLRQAGASLVSDEQNSAWQHYPMGVIDLKDELLGTTEFRAVTPNFFALTQYNRSYFYATAVGDLAQALTR